MTHYKCHRKHLAETVKISANGHKIHGKKSIQGKKTIYQYLLVLSRHSNLLVLKRKFGPPCLGAMLKRQPPERYSEIGTVKRVDERIDGRIDPP